MLGQTLRSISVETVIPQEFFKDMEVLDLSNPAGRDRAELLLSKRGSSATKCFIGRYNEDRAMYLQYDLFRSGGERTVHLGVDLFVVPGTPVSSPIAGIVHSFADNDHPGDYGPTIILQHAIGDVGFFTLYGHLSRDSLVGLSVGDKFAAGKTFARIGDSSVNGGWQPHLHFQIIADMLGKRGDFPGVCSRADRERFLMICPDPNLLLRIPLLQH